MSTTTRIWASIRREIAKGREEAERLEGIQTERKPVKRPRSARLAASAEVPDDAVSGAAG